jgi:hypothetical protein
MLTQRDNGNRADRKNAVSHFDGVQSSLRKWLT